MLVHESPAAAKLAEAACRLAEMAQLQDEEPPRGDLTDQYSEKFSYRLGLMLIAVREYEAAKSPKLTGPTPRDCSMEGQWT